MEYDIKSGLFLFDVSEAELVADSVPLKSTRGPSPVAVYRVTKLEIEAMDRARGSLSEYPERKEEFERTYQEKTNIVKTLKPLLNMAMTVVFEDVKQNVLE